MTRNLQAKVEAIGSPEVSEAAPAEHSVKQPESLDPTVDAQSPVLQAERMATLGWLACRC